jgi:ATP-binding cassette subfamily F protein uup
VLGLNGDGKLGHFADYKQWEDWRQAQQSIQEPEIAVQTLVKNLPSRRKLSYIEAREYATLEQRIHTAEALLAEKTSALESEDIATDAVRLLQAQKESDEAQDSLNSLYERWLELESKL